VGRPRLVVLRALGLGDLLTGVPAFRALAEQYPDHERMLAAPAELAPLVELIDGAIDRVVDTRELEPLPASLHAADIAVNLHGRGPESHRVLLDTGPRRLIAFAHPDVPETRGMPEWREGEHVVRRWCRLLSETGAPADPSRLRIRPPDLDLPDRVRGATLVHPGAASPARRWPAERWAAVVRAERDRGRRVIITGRPEEAELAQRVSDLADSPPAGILAGQTDLIELAALVAAAGRVACADTGIAHLATALGTPSVVLFGPTPPSEWGPPPAEGRHRALWAGHRGDPHADHPDAGLLEIRPAQVVRELERL
jgi:ADP-heptose:LPS heptosyltransferase